MLFMIKSLNLWFKSLCFPEQINHTASSIDWPLIVFHFNNLKINGKRNKKYKGYAADY